jgi:hypothetical protein
LTADPFKLVRILLAAVAAMALGFAVSACGGSSDSSTDSSSSTASTESSTTESTSTDSTDAASTEPASTTPSTSSACSDVETYDVKPAGTHFDREFTAADYPTSPPIGGDHNPTPIEAGQFYDKPPRLGESVHLLEHGAVIGWTNGLSPEDKKAVQDAFSAEYQKGYYQLAVVENPDMDGGFAMTTWDSLQRCDSIDPAAISSFIEDHYAPSTTAEGALACTGKASRLPACKTRTDP